jgi:hypothetical protein
MVLVISVGEVHASNVHSSLNQLSQHLYGLSLGACEKTRGG